MEKELFLSALAESDAFGVYLQHHSAIAAMVVQHTIVMKQTSDSMELSDLLAGRNAVAALYGIAYEAGFQALAAIFYLSYERYCRCLLSYA